MVPQKALYSKNIFARAGNAKMLDVRGQISTEGSFRKKQHISPCGTLTS